MRIHEKTLTAALALGLSLTALPAMANPGKGNGHGGHHGHAAQQHGGCPPGLAKKSPSCVPPGQARKNDIRYGRYVGDRLRVGDYALVRDYSRYDIERRDDWRYYRDGDRLIRVDAQTQQILTIINLARVLLN